jgi:hypothetical protein
MPLGELTRSLIRASVMGENEGVLGACVINNCLVYNTPVVTHLVDDDCLLIPYTRITLREGDGVDLGKVLKDRNLRGVEGVAYDYIITIGIGGVRYVIKVIDTAVPWGTVAAGALSEDYVTFDWYHIEDRFLRIVKPLKGVEKLEEAANRLMGRLPFVEYTRVVDGSIEGNLLRRIILGTAIRYYPGFSRWGSIYLCSNGVIMPSAEGEDCALIQFEKRITDESTFFDFINEFSLIGVDVGVLIARSARVYPVTVKLKSAYGDAAAYALIMLDRYRRVDDTVLVLTPSLRRLIREAMNAVEVVQGDELLREAGLT